MQGDGRRWAPVSRKNKMTTIDIDGAAGEGGGQILRSSLALAMCTGRPVRIERIRAGRSRPGLMRQHLTCVQAAVAVSGAQVDGAELGSQQLVFQPGAVRAGDYEFNVGSAGSCTLVLQTVLPALMLAGGPSQLRLKGGTHNPMAPPFHFLERCFAPLVRRLGVGLTLELRRHGFYPAGGGEMLARVQPAEAGLRPVDVTARGALRRAQAEALVAAVPYSVAQRELAAVAQALGWPHEQLLTPPLRQNEGPGNALMLSWEHDDVCELVTAHGSKGISAEAVAAGAVKEARAWLDSSGALGPHLADQWMLPLALAVAASGRAAAFTCSELTQHARTNMEVIEHFLPVRLVASGQDDAWRVDVQPQTR